MRTFTAVLRPFIRSLPTMAVLGVLLSGAAARAQSVVTAFTGTYTENFESFPDQSQQLFVPNPTPVFGGHGTLSVNSATFGAIAIYNASTPFAPYQPSDGAQFAVTQSFDNILSITFDADATKFGGFFGQAEETGSSVGKALVITLLNASNGVVGSGSFVPVGENDSSLVFFGLQNATPFRTITIAPASPALILLDGLQVTIPEPATMTTLGLGAIGLLRRRRATRA